MTSTVRGRADREAWQEIVRIHESGHLVISAALGHVAAEIVSYDRGWMVGSQGEDQRSLEDLLVIRHAGWAALEVVGFEHPLAGASDDLKHAARCAELLRLGVRGKKAYEDRARELCRAWASHIIGLADLLTGRTVLSGDEVVAALRLATNHQLPIRGGAMTLGVELAYRDLALGRPFRNARRRSGKHGSGGSRSRHSTSGAGPPLTWHDA